MNQLGTKDRNAGNGAVSVKRTVRASTACTPDGSNWPFSIQATPLFNFSARSNDQRTASASTGVPSWNLALSTRWKVQVRPSALVSQELASQGTIFASGPSYLASASY